MQQLHEKDWVPLTGPMYLKEAEVISGLLEEAEIPVKLAGSNGERYYNLSPQLSTTQVLVPKQHLEEACRLLDVKEKEAEGK